MAVNSQLISLVANDRATFGGMLICCGVVVHLMSLWGFRRGERWVWWTLLTAGTTAYLSTIAIHFAVGYTSFIHLLPAYAGVIALAIGSALAGPFLLAGPDDWHPDSDRVERS